MLIASWVRRTDKHPKYSESARVFILRAKICLANHHFVDIAAAYTFSFLTEYLDNLRSTHFYAFVRTAKLEQNI